MDGEKLDVDFDSVRKKIKDKDSALNKYINKALDEIDPGVLKTMVLNLGFEAFLNGTKTIRKMREKEVDSIGGDYPFIEGAKRIE